MNTNQQRKEEYLMNKGVEESFNNLRKAIYQTYPKSEIADISRYIKQLNSIESDLKERISV